MREMASGMTDEELQKIVADYKEGRKNSLEDRSNKKQLLGNR